MFIWLQTIKTIDLYSDHKASKVARELDEMGLARLNGPSHTLDLDVKVSNPILLKPSSSEI